MFCDNFSKFFETEIEQNKMTSFVKYSLPAYEGAKTYKFSDRARLGDYQNYLIDNLWNVTTDVHTMHKCKSMINALINYFNRQGLQPQNKMFLYDVVYSDPKSESTIHGERQNKARTKRLTHHGQENIILKWRTWTSLRH